MASFVNHPILLSIRLRLPDRFSISIQYVIITWWNGPLGYITLIQFARWFCAKSLQLRLHPRWYHAIVGKLSTESVGNRRRNGSTDGNEDRWEAGKCTWIIKKNKSFYGVGKFLHPQLPAPTWSSVVCCMATYVIKILISKKKNQASHTRTRINNRSLCRHFPLLWQHVVLSDQ